MINSKMFSMIEVMKLYLYPQSIVSMLLLYALTNEIPENIRDLVLFFVPDVSSFLP